ncbi:hypothetical protein OHA44_15855 [Streptomyces sp. NBC_00144]|uniref:hypothetical protein n=1 Tax=unclassified Streptomyces TaxID=2593676 RepID=UPI003243B1C6|nr:hypothetical protein OG221_15905 [Streptomyces sp. NBC_00932]
MTGDPRQADVEASQALLDQVDRDDAVQLPALSTAELCVLGAMQATLVDEDAWSWWSGKAEAERFELSAMALKFLVHRGLLAEPEPGPAEQDPGPGDESGASETGDAPGESVGLPVRPLLAMILAGRTQPSFIVVRREGAKAEPDRMRLYGIAEEGRGLRAVLAEEATGNHVSRFGPAYKYVLASPAEAVRSLLRWVDRPPAGHRFGRRPSKVIDVYQPNKGMGPDLDRFEVRRSSAGLSVERNQDGTPIDCDEETLGRHLSELLSGPGSAA